MGRCMDSYDKNEYMKEWVKTRTGLIQKIYQHQKQASLKRNFKMGYTLKKLREWVSAQPNFKALDWGWFLSGYNRWQRPSIDRIDSKKGYSLGNIQLMTWKENWKKGHIDIIKNPLPQNVTGVTGVSYNDYGRGKKKWVAKLYVSRKRFEKRFLSFDEAVKHRKYLEKTHYG